MITNLNFPLDISKRKQSLSRLSWSEIKSIISNGNGPHAFMLGDTKDGATLIDISTTEATFSLGNVGQACIAPFAPRTNVVYNFLADFSVYKSGWMSDASYASSRGVTYSSVYSSLPSAMKNVMYSFSRSARELTASDKDPNTSSYSTDSQTTKLYAPTRSEWSTYYKYMPHTGTFWTQDISSFNTVWGSGSETPTKVLTMLKFYTKTGNTTSYDGFYENSSTGWNRRGTETLGLVLFFKIHA